MRCHICESTVGTKHTDRSFKTTRTLSDGSEIDAYMCRDCLLKCEIFPYTVLYQYIDEPLPKQKTHARETYHAMRRAGLIRKRES